ncbi:MAG: AAA family ATPase, partial [Candidatus Bathyarchaeota archaeon]|nr:AAA family ATPase [Candidatus Bathyarchaeota archaeon]
MLVTGTPGVGKTTVSKLLASKLNAQYVSVTDIVKSKNFVEEVDEKRETLVADTAKVLDELNNIIDNSESDM